MRWAGLLHLLSFIGAACGAATPAPVEQASSGDVEAAPAAPVFDELAPPPSGCRAATGRLPDILESVITYDFDAEGRIRSSHAEARVDGTTFDQEWVYGDGGQLRERRIRHSEREPYSETHAQRAEDDGVEVRITIEDDVVVERWRFDREGRPVAVEVSMNGMPQAFECSYDDAGRLSGVVRRIAGESREIAYVYGDDGTIPERVDEDGSPFQEVRRRGDWISFEDDIGRFVAYSPGCHQLLYDERCTPLRGPVPPSGRRAELPHP